MKRIFTALALFGSAVAIVAQSPQLPPAHTLYAAVAMTKAQKNSSMPEDSGVYRRNPDGRWEYFGPRILGVAGLAFDPSDPRVVLLASADGVVRSADGGRSWRKVTGWEVADVRSIVFDAVKPNQVYAVTAWGPLRSTDAGITWQLAQPGLDRLYGQAIAVDPTTAGHVWVGNELGLYVSTNAAESWQRVSFPAVPVLRLATDARADVLLATTQGKGAFVSRDRGRNWLPVDPATAGADLYAAAIAPQDRALMALGGWHAGVRVSRDGGATWADATAGLPVRDVFVLAFDPDVKGRLWASTFEEGTFYSDDFGHTWHNADLYGAYGSDFFFVPNR